MTLARVIGAAFAGNFQTAWYLTIICSFGAIIVGWGIFQVIRTLRSMSREGDVLLFAAMVTLIGLVVSFFVALGVMVLISLGPPVGR